MKHFNYVYFAIIVVLFLITTVISVSDIQNLSFLIKATIVATLTTLFIISEFWQNKKIAKKTESKIIKALLSKVDELFVFSGAEQNVRANIFKKSKGKDKDGKKTDGYQIIHQYNMDSNADRDMFIPINMGVTGEVFRTNTPLFSKRQQFRGNASYRLPSYLLDGVPENINWIYSCPIKSKKGKVQMTLTLDGDAIITTTQQEQEIKDVAKKIIDNLNKIVLDED